MSEHGLLWLMKNDQPLFKLSSGGHCCAWILCRLSSLQMYAVVFAVELTCVLGNAATQSDRGEQQHCTGSGKAPKGSRGQDVWCLLVLALL